MKDTSLVWVFDLDDTLHDASARIFPLINHAMTQYLKAHLHLEEEDANRLRKEYWQRYGATLTGMMKHHGIDPHHFLRHTHPLPQLGNLVTQTRGLRVMLRRLPGRKIIFTNAPMHYAVHVLKQLKIRHLVDGIFSIESARFRPKPSRAGFARLLYHFRLQARRCAMVEDSLPALKTAKMLGMKTIFVHPVALRPPFVDVCINSVLALPKVAATLM